MATNIAVIQGRLVRDMEIKTTNNGTVILNNAVAVERNFKNKNGERETDFINITAFNKTAENMERFFKKGDGIIINGRIQTNQYEKDGQKRTSTDVIVNEFDFPLSRPSENSQSRQQANDPFANNDEIEIDSSDLPF